MVTFHAQFDLIDLRSPCRKAPWALIGSRSWSSPVVMSHLCPGHSFSL